jgi:hypothetical protein
VFRDARTSYVRKNPIVEIQNPGVAIRYIR